jgi:hypothetical protein
MCGGSDAYKCVKSKVGQCKMVGRADQPTSAMPRSYNADPNGCPSFSSCLSTISKRSSMMLDARLNLEYHEQCIFGLSI